MTDWIYYEEKARDMMRQAFIYEANPKKIMPKDIKRFAKDENLVIRDLNCAYENVKHKFNPNDDFQKGD